MPNFDNFLKWAGKAGTMLGDWSRSSVTDLVLGHVGVSVQFVRSTGNVTAKVAAQTVVIAHKDPFPDQISGGAGVSGQIDIYVIGATTLDVKRGDLFDYSGTRYKITMLTTSIDGRIKCGAEAMR